MTVRMVLVAAALFVADPARAQQVDISGEWAARVHEDQPHRGPGGVARVESRFFAARAVISR